MKSRVEKGRQDAMFRSGPVAWAEIQGVVGVDSIGYDRESAFLRHHNERGEQLVFAEIAAIRGVCAVPGIFHFVRFDEFMANAQLADKILHYSAVMRGVAWGQAGQRQG